MVPRQSGPEEWASWPVSGPGLAAFGLIWFRLGRLLLEHNATSSAVAARDQTVESGEVEALDKVHNQPRTETRSRNHLFVPLPPPMIRRQAAVAASLPVNDHIPPRRHTQRRIRCRQRAWLEDFEIRIGQSERACGDEKDREQGSRHRGGFEGSRLSWKGLDSMRTKPHCGHWPFTMGFAVSLAGSSTTCFAFFRCQV